MNQKKGNIEMTEKDAENVIINYRDELDRLANSGKLENGRKIENDAENRVAELMTMMIMSFYLSTIYNISCEAKLMEYGNKSYDFILKTKKRNIYIENKRKKSMKKKEYKMCLMDICEKSCFENDDIAVIVGINNNAIASYESENMLSFKIQNVLDKILDKKHLENEIRTLNDIMILKLIAKHIEKINHICTNSCNYKVEYRINEETELLNEDLELLYKKRSSSFLCIFQNFFVYLNRTRTGGTKL